MADAAYAPTYRTYPISRAAWNAIHDDFKGLAMVDSPTGWTAGQPYCFTSFIPDLGPEKNGGCAIAPVSIVEDARPTSAARSCACWCNCNRARAKADFIGYAENCSPCEHGRHRADASPPGDALLPGMAVGESAP